MPNRNFLQAFPDQDLIQPCLQEGSLLPPQTFTDSAAVREDYGKLFKTARNQWSINNSKHSSLLSPSNQGRGELECTLSSHQERVYSALFNRHVLTGGELFVGPVTPVVEGVRFTHLAVAEHDSGSAAVGLENTRTEIDVCNADDHREAEEDIVEHTGPEEDLIAERNLHAAVRGAGPY